MVDILRPNYGQVWASEGEKVSPVEDKMKLGWVQEMMPFQWENYLQGRQDDAILYLLQKGIAEYSPSQEYVAQKSVVVYQGAVYIALETVTGVLPSVSSSWKRLSTISDASGVVSIAGGGTGASTAAAARANLGLGSAALLAADSVVQKDTSGNFTAGVITASLAGNAATADKLKTARTVQITGAVTSTATQFDGSSNLAVPVTAIDASALTQGSVPASALGNSVTKTSATGAAILPVGTTAERPVSPAFGHFRGNTTSGILEYYNGAEWATSTAQSLSYVLNRGNHTGTQVASTVTGLSVGPTFTTVPTTFQSLSIIVTLPHLRFMVWDGTKYIRAPWHQPGVYFYAHDPLGKITHGIQVRTDVTYNTADHPDLAEHLGVTTATFVLPGDGRARVLRGADLGAGTDAALVDGYMQGDAGRDLTAYLGAFLGNEYSDGAAYIGINYGTHSAASSQGGFSFMERFIDASRQWPTANEFRVKSLVARLYMTR